MCNWSEEKDCWAEVKFECKLKFIISSSGLKRDNNEDIARNMSKDAADSLVRIFLQDNAFEWRNNIDGLVLIDVSAYKSRFSLSRPTSIDVKEKVSHVSRLGFLNQSGWHDKVQSNTLMRSQIRCFVRQHDPTHVTKSHRAVDCSVSLHFYCVQSDTPSTHAR